MNLFGRRANFQAYFAEKKNERGERKANIKIDDEASCKPVNEHTANKIAFIAN